MYAISVKVYFHSICLTYIQKTENNKFDFFRKWILLTSFILVTILLVESSAKKSNKDKEPKDGREKQKKVDAELDTK